MVVFVTPWLMQSASIAQQLRHAPPLMMPSPLRVRERTSRVWAQVVSVQNELLDQALGNDLGRGDDEESPAVLSEDICLVPGKPMVRVEQAPGNARRIFTGIDIVADEPNILEVVWQTLTDYENLDKVVPNLIGNEVVSRTENGARLRQIGAAKLGPGITFKATTTLDVETYPDGLPVDMEADHLAEENAEPSQDSAAVREFDSALPLTWNVFPRPYCISSLPHRDVTMQGVRGIGDFRHYQGVWRMQELPGCAPPGASAMRLTYSVELSPRAWVPVALLEGRIATALGENLEAVRNFACLDAAARAEVMVKGSAP
jgi:hypothetical protein